MVAGGECRVEEHWSRRLPARLSRWRERSPLPTSLGATAAVRVKCARREPDPDADLGEESGGQCHTALARP
jgi:hypothetical protein